MKKILCLIDVIGFGGGAERQMTGLIQLLKKEGYIVDSVVYHYSDDIPSIKDRYGFAPTVLSVNNNPLSKLLAVRKFIKKSGGYDCVITYKVGPNAIGCILRLVGMKFKLIVSERIVTQSLSLRNRLRFSLYRFADYVVPNSYSEGELLSKHFPFLKKKIKVITNFTDTSIFYPINSKNNRDVRKVLTVARVVPQKNVMNYIDAIRLLFDRGVDKVLFEWYGGSYTASDDLYSKKAQAKVEELGLINHFSFYPPTMDIANQYRDCDIFCLPSSFEGFPNVICEAMSCGKPIACSRVCDNPYIVSENENGVLFDPTNPVDIADRLQKMIEMSSEDINSWGEKSIKIAENRFSPKAFIDKYCELIES